MRVSAGFFVTGRCGNTLIHTLPPRRMRRLIAIRAASICRFVIHAGSSALSPYWPKCTSVLPRDNPARRPRWCLRCLTRLGRSIAYDPCPDGGRSAGRTARHGGPPPTLRATAVAPVAALLRAALLRLGLEVDAAAGVGDALRQHLAAVDPHLDADAPERGLRLVEAVVDVGAERVQRHPPVGVVLRPRHLGAAEPSRALDLRALGAGAHGGRQRALHRAAEADPVLQLLRDRLGDQPGVELRALDLVDVDLDLLLREQVQLAGAARRPPGRSCRSRCRAAP